MNHENDVEKGEEAASSQKQGPTTSTINPAIDESAIRHIHSNTFSHRDNTISLREVDLVDVRIRNLSVTVDESPRRPTALVSALARKRGKLQSENRHVKTILDDISADMPSGTLTAIIGGSGSGKTSMLNVMSRRMHSRRLDISGTTSFNGGDDFASVRSAYVMQQDVLLPTLTVRETLRYAADLRLPSSVNREERRRVVEETILELGLKEAADTRIGNHAHRGCSGGEKRRTSIGVQLLANPSVLFLDEPTTGLDATSAFQLVRTLKLLAKKGRTIITTIHQPRSEIWSLFDIIVLLTRGCPAYSGPAVECLPYFARLGYELPPFVNPAEHLIDVVAVDTRSPELEAASSARVEWIKAAWREHSAQGSPEGTSIQLSRSNAVSSPKSFTAYHSAVLRQTRVLTARTWTVTLRDPMGMFGSLIEAFSMGIVAGWIFYDLGSNLEGIRSREGALYTAAALQGYLILLYETYRLTVDIELFDRERGEGVVGVPAFLISRRLARFLIEDIPVPLIFSIIFYFMVGFRTSGDQFMTFFGVMLLEQYIAVCFATVCVAVSRNFAGASLVANLAYTLQSMACGYFVQSNTIPIYVRWTKWIAYCFYAFGALAANEFVGYIYDCPEPGGTSNPACKQYTGQYIMDSLGLPHDWVWRPILALLGFALTFYLGAAFILRYWKTEISMSRSRPMDSDESAGKEKMTARSGAEVRTVNIRLDGYTLDIEKRSWYGRKTRELAILKPVTADFEPGLLNVIMGPSGSGKTSLLNSMARRLKDDFTTKYRSFGRLLFNGSIASEEVIRSICSFVTQDDDALLSSLTVRETLRFAAGLRLPTWMSKEEKNSRAESVLLKMGLKDCADILIGNEFVKGISGGEKRRVTIAVQILTNPRVLLLDEPTSGLDAFTASSIIDVLRGLADEGRTLILTIHQSRSDLFPHFANVLLLARGGSPVYAGPGREMLSHFANQGFRCPRTTNPADFALDLITVDLQHEAKELASRAKVRNLIESWSSEKFPRAPTTSISSPAELGSLARNMATLRTAFPLLVHRAVLNFSRQPPILVGRIMQVLGLGLVLALFFARLKNDYFSIQNRLGFVQEIAPIYFVGMLQNVAVYPLEKDVFYREYEDRAYSVEAFFLQYTVIEIPFEIISSILFAVLADLACGLPRTAELFFIVAFNCFCIVSCGESVGILFNTLFAHTGFAVNVTSVFLSVAQTMGGIMSLNIPAFLQAFNYLSPVKYLIGNLAPYTLREQKFTCEAWQRTNGQCPITTGEEVLKLYNLDKNPRIQLMALAICTIFYRLLAYMVLKMVKQRWIAKVWGWRKGRRESGDSQEEERPQMC
ncbi:P-loop containing nucleoside triphosphate hydrolase protein [Lepidopterella palustris CBS 459.81]|uniref:P-loop containing nucleoside triphosphate hydrolase protein n=1 Tax=Lepidopterella palustris CBS 459.81 TaxID=1314670 RepID=A0A8E2EH63_9PEZI|nr:P-loop containing nucleoside triphosphate hydrolase protein [Lepidopterella palustris CBS 459.81]